MNLAATVITLLVLELCGLLQSLAGSSGAEAGTHLFWVGALTITIVAVTTIILIV